jgi:hypothetical protein
MAKRSPIFSIKGDRPQIGYVENDGAFDPSGRRRCNYSAATGNLFDLNSGKIVGYVSLEGYVVGASWIADELFTLPARREPDAGTCGNVPDRPTPHELLTEPSREPTLGAPDPLRSPAPEDDLLQQAIGWFGAYSRTNSATHSQPSIR